ncbi:hypothetical protein [Allomesorhizobium alhagi]|uniref:Uncharacterized protein n=1 Tax=Mesorhizobium alhagi CCNWXJ12-2 TaxID=1107882 RepID=H0I410_9HYPH|nr:hypothetical protein [Mesorhizobium alhagi]EHK52286.1 hypothetical protein MAXJ12_36146 [Mesorhizobium alhagi CCNWXJ12-2]
MYDSVLSLFQGLLSADGYGVWPLLAGAGFMVWRNASRTAESRLHDHQIGANRSR